MQGKRIVAAKGGDGRITLLEQDIPPTGAGMVLVEVHSSLVSPGTELGGWHALRRQMESPAGGEAKPFGYANAGVVRELGRGAGEFKVGQRVACMGAGYALHSDYAVVPQHLCVALPEGVGFDQGAYGHLGATAIHALRRGAPEFGEYVAVVGLGLIGQLTAQAYHLAGNFVIGWEQIGFRLEVARRWGIDAAVQVGREDELEATRAFTRGLGLDAAMLAFGGQADRALAGLEQCLKRSPDGHPVGRIVVVGGARFQYASTFTNADIRRASRTGPGYHDPAWETGADYPPALVRWSTRANLELCMRLIAEGRLDVDCLTTHVMPLRDVETAIPAILDDPDRILGVVFRMEH